MREVQEKIVFDETRTPTENFYHAVYGEWPELDCPKCAVKLLAGYVDYLCNYEDVVCGFFGLGCERAVPEIEDSESWMRIRIVIERLQDDETDGPMHALYADSNREDYWTNVIEACYGMYSSAIDEALAYVLAQVIADAIRDNARLKIELAIKSESNMLQDKARSEDRKKELDNRWTLAKEIGRYE